MLLSILLATLGHFYLLFCVNIFHFFIVSVDVKQRLQLDDELPFFVGDVLSVEFLQTIDASARDQAVQRVGFLQVTTVRGLAAAHLDLDRDGRLPLFADGDLLVLAFDGCSAPLRQCSDPSSVQGGLL